MFVNEKLQEFERYIRNRRVALVGLDETNIQLIDYFADKGANVTVFDEKTIDKMDKSILDKITTRCINFSFGEHYLISLVGFDLIIRASTCRIDCPEIKAESVRGAVITSELELVIDLCPGKVIGVTGSDGKTTTAKLIYEILKEKGYVCYLGGNIGERESLLTKINEMKQGCIIVLELDSIQLMGIKTSPEIAVITNISKEYPYVHNNFNEYVDSIKNICEFQDDNGKVVLNYDNEFTRKISSEAPGKPRMFSAKTRLDNGVIFDKGILKSCVDGVRMHIMTIDEAISIYGIHNYENICAAIGATEDLVDPYVQLRAITKFKGLEHRLEMVKNVNGIKWYDDSLGTSSSRTIAGMNAFNEKIVLITGDYDCNSNYTELAQNIVNRVSKLILTGSTADKIETAVLEQLKETDINIPIYKLNTLDECVEKAYEIAEPKEIVLFSPSSGNCNNIKIYEEKGIEFKNLVDALK